MDCSPVGKFTPVHDAWWTTARKAHGDAAAPERWSRSCSCTAAPTASTSSPGWPRTAARALTADAVALEARKAADETDVQPAADAAVFPPAVASLTARRLDKLPPDTRPLPSVVAYDNPRKLHQAGAV